MLIRHCRNPYIQTLTNLLEGVPRPYAAKIGVSDKCLVENEPRMQILIQKKIFFGGVCLGRFLMTFARPIRTHI